MKIAISACLLGIPCRYDHKGCYDQNVAKLQEEHELVPVCPEMLAKLGTPRDPCELVCGRVITKQGKDITDQLHQGLDETMKIIDDQNCQCAVLQQRSPTCGCGLIYDGTFSSKLIPGNGLLTQRLLERNTPVFSNEEIGADFHVNVEK